ncbi:MAG: hypothetical protein IJX87_04430 [Clostridia bacterium]|nr:hypothetical protein [Clostridia bacterium]
MKRKTYHWLAVVLCLWTAMMAACQKSGEVQSAEVLVSSDSVLTIRVVEAAENATLYDVMKKLKEEGKIEFVSENSTYGQSIVSINGVENPSDWSYYWASYTTDKDNGEYAFTREETDWYYAAAGISYLPVKNGETYMFEYIENTYNG